MLENLFVTDKMVQPEKLANVENLNNQVMKVLAGKNSNTATLKFISQLQTGKIFDAVFTGNTSGGKGILTLEGNQLNVELPKVSSIEGKNGRGEPTKVPLETGQAIKVRVENSGARPALKIISPQSRKAPTHYEETKTSLTHRGKSISRQFSSKENFQTHESPNRVINARIIQVLDSKSIMVSTGNQNIVVPVENIESLQPGLQVSISLGKMEKGQTPTLIPINTSSTKKIDFTSLKPYLPTRMPIAKLANLLASEILDSPMMEELKTKPEVVASLRGTLKLLLPREGKIPSENQIRQQVESSGINYEAKVRKVLASGQSSRNMLASDLKGLLLELYQSAEKASLRSSEKISGPLGEFRQTIKFAIDNIELNQLSSQISKQENQPLVIQIPNPLSPGNKTIQLYVRKDSSGDDDETKNKQNSHNVAFFLDLSFLGKIKISAQVGAERLSVRIDTESEDVANYIRSKANDFKEKMNAHEIETSVECCVADKVKPIKDSLIELLVSQNTSLVNIET